MKAKIYFQWTLRILLILAVLANFLPVQTQSVLAKPLAGTFTNCAAQSEISPTECEALVALYNNTGGANWINNTGWLQTDTPCSWSEVNCDGSSVTELHLSDNQLTGSIPTELGNLTNLTLLALSGNQLTGSIPTQLGNLTNLAALWLDNNQLTGSIPTQLGNLTYLDDLSLENNRLTGFIPSELGNLTLLKYLWLDHNYLTGSIPLQLGNLPYLQWLALEYNHLSGEFPTSIINLSSLVNFTFDCWLTSSNASVIAFINARSPGWHNKVCVLKNSGFELYPTGAAKIPSSWKAVNFAATDGKTTTVKREGAASVKISGIAGKVKTLSQTLNAGGKAGDAFTFSYWVRGSAIPTAGVCQAQVLFYNGTALKSAKTLKCPAAVTYNFQKMTLNIVAPAAYTKIVIQFVYSKPHGTVWFDAVSWLLR